MFAVIVINPRKNMFKIGQNWVDNSCNDVVVVVFVAIVDDKIVIVIVDHSGLPSKFVLFQ